MAEVIEMLSEKQEPIMARGTREFFKMLSENIKKLEKRPDDYLEVFKDFMEIKNHF